MKKITLHYPDGIHNNYGIVFEGLENIPYDFENFSYSNIQYFVNTNCPKKLRYFYQGGFAIPEESNGWGFIEFWSDDQNLILDFVLKLSKYFGIEVE